jgi:hypothetical protein
MNASIRFLGSVIICALALTTALTTSADATVPAGRYTISAGSVTDTKTKLVWQQTPAPTLYIWSDAKTYCAGVGASLGGMGWRLPTLKELQTIVDDSRGSPSIDPTAFPSMSSMGFWSSSPLVGSSSLAWLVSFDSGATASIDITSTVAVRCVR